MTFQVMLNIMFYWQEIKFDPNVMCEPIDWKLTFRGSQVCAITCHRYTVMPSPAWPIAFNYSGYRFFYWNGFMILLCFCSLKMGTLFAFRNPFEVKLVNNIDFLTFLHF